MQDLSCDFTIIPFRKKLSRGKNEHMYIHYNHLMTPWAAEVINIIICRYLDTGMVKYRSSSCFPRELKNLGKLSSSQEYTLGVSFLKLQSTLFRFVYLSSKSAKQTYFESFPDVNISGNIWDKCCCYSFANLLTSSSLKLKNAG